MSPVAYLPIHSTADNAGVTDSLHASVTYQGYIESSLEAWFIERGESTTGMIRLELSGTQPSIVGRR